MSLAEEIVSKLGVTATPIPGAKAQFDVLADGRLLFSKDAEGRFPDEGEVLALLEATTS